MRWPIIAAISLSRIGGLARAGIVHRLDMGTSGLIVCAKSDRAHLALIDQFAHHGRDGGRDGRLERAYLALVWGRPPPGPEVIKAAIGRHRLQRHKMAVRQFGGRAAETEFRLIERVGRHASLLRCRLFTGRTHQIRVHLHWQGWGVVGDPVYRLRKQGRAAHIERQALHAARLSFIHPASKERLSFDSPLPADIEAAISNLKQDMPA